jgi:hypothetical protein
MKDKPMRDFTIEELKYDNEICEIRNWLSNNQQLRGDVSINCADIDDIVWKYLADRCGSSCDDLDLFRSYQPAVAVVYEELFNHEMNYHDYNLSYS